MKLIEIGKVVRSHGLGGRIKVLSYLQSPDVLESVSDLFLGESPAAVVAYPLGGIQNGEGFFIMKLAGIDNRNEAEKLRGLLVWMSAEKMKPLQEDEYYWQDIIGMQAFTEENEPLGRIETVFPTGSNDVYVCRDDQREILIPALVEVIIKIDVERRVMVVRLPEGFFEQ
ncbi:MAG: ribosome maturation factor RimM [Syntrophales bacterium]|jgi:16S rRNA processing protein RimM|nr:ribosome maturation factor RimM [Syntrophales bacterium]